MKRHAVIIALKAEHSDTEITHFLKIAQPFVIKVQKKLEAADGDPTSVAKPKTHAQNSNTIRKHEFISNSKT